ncbi:MAG: PKD domain-containing protein [Bacteroidota bacterium]
MKNHYKKTTLALFVLFTFVLQIASYKAKAQYCVTPQYSLGSGCGYNFYMSDFQFAGISNTTTCSTIAPYYTYYSAMTATVEQNGGYSVSMSFPTISPYLAYFKMYIDYNDNNSFDDAGEEVYNSGNLASLTSVANGYVVIPVDAPLGTHRLRVRCADGDVNSCTDDGTIGEVEDYNVTIQPQPLSANAGYSQYPSCSQSTITIGGFPSASGGTAPYTYSWSPSINLSDTTSSNPTLTVIPTTTYSASVTYTLTVTDANNNTASSIAFINLPYTSATANAGSDMSDCRQQLFGFEGTGSGTYFHWDFGDGGSADVQDAATYEYRYAAPGYYNAVFTVTDNNGCAVHDTVVVHAKGPNVDAGGGTYHNYNVCGTVVDFASATTNGEGYYWAFGCDCVSNPNLNPVFDYQTYGSYVATLYATDNDGCQNSSSATISLNEVPHANAGPDQTVCPGTRVSLGDNSSIGQMNWWDFGDGNTGYGLLTDNTYAAVGTYYAVLSSGFDNSCGVSVDTAIITVAEPFVDFGGGGSVCGLTVDFIANAPSAISYSWNFGDGVTSTEANPSHTFNYYGTYSVTLSITTANGCTASTTASITLDQPPYANAGLNVTACAGVQTTLNAVYSNGTTYSWNFGDGNSYNDWVGSNTYANGGTYYATMTVSNQNACPDAVDTAVVTVHQPTADAGSDQTVCFNGGVISFVGTASDATSYSWNFGDGNTDTLQNTIHTYASAGTYPVSFTAYNGTCSATSYFNAILDLPPVANAGADLTACAGVQTTLNAVYSNGATYTWNFGDGQSYNDWLGYNNYANGGTYYATMTVSNQNACPDAVDTAVVTVHQPTADAGSDQTVCFNGGVISFVGTASDATSYSWNFGDGNTDTLQNTIHTYASAGTYPVSFTAYNGTCSATSYFNAILDLPPVANAGADLTACAGVQTTLNAVYSNGATYTWNFGDGQSYNDWLGYNTYANGGTYYATMTVSNQNACPDAVDTAVVTVHQPTADAGSDQTVCLAGGVISFNGISTDATSYSWNFGDGNTDTLQNPSHTYTYPYSYSVTFTAYNGSCSAYSSFAATVNTPLVADAGPDVTGCAGVSVYLNGGGSSNGANYNWNFGDGNTGTSYGEANTYSTGGIYYATLTVSNQSGCPDVIDTAIVTIHQPTANAGPDQTVCLNGGVISFVGNASDATSYLWYFGDGNTDTLQNPTFNYTYAGTYNVTFNSYYGSCSATSSFTTTLIAPTSSTQNLTICSGQNIVVGSNTYTTSGTYTDVLTSINGCDSTVTTNLSVNPALSGSQTLTICAGTNISVGSNTYSASGTYNDILITISGCDSVVTTNLTVSPAITGSQSLTICAGANITVGTNTYSSTGVYNDVLLAFGGCDSIVTTTLTVNPAITNTQTFIICAGNSVSVGSNIYNSSGMYIDVLLSSNGCDSIVTTNLTVLPSISGSQTLVLCAGVSVNVGTSSYTSSGIFTDILTAFNGCDSIVSTNLTINPAIINSQSYNLCAGGSITVGSNTYSISGVYTDVFTAFNGCDSTLTTNLSIGGLIAGTQSLIVCPGGTVSVGTNTYNTNGIYVDTLTAFAGCDSIVTTNLTVIVQLAVASSSVNTCYGASQTLSVNGGSGTIYWSPALGLNTNVGNSVVASPFNTTMYYVTDTVGACQMIDSTLLTVNPLITADAGVHQSLCLGDTATFIAIGTGGSGTYSYSWGDGVHSYSTDTISIVPTSNLTFTLTITDAAVCSATDTVTFSSRHTDIYGLVTYSGGILSHGTNNKAILYRWYNPNLAQFDTMQVSSIDTVSGYFHFTNVYNNNLLIKIFPDTSVYGDHFVPSYYNAANSPTSLWDSTTFFTHTCNAEDTLNIVMVENQTLSGSGRISGRLIQGPFYSPLAIGMPRVQGDPIPGGDVKIGNNPGGQMIAATTTSSLDSPDGGGYYYFDSIPVGHYDIYIDIPGLLRDSVWTINITATDTVFTNLDYWVDSSDIYPIYPDINVQTPIIKGLESTFIVYPNPFRTNATIEYTVSHDAQVKLEVYSMIGDKINTLVNDNQQTGKYRFNLNASNRKLSNGIYFIKLTLGNDSFTKRVVVME